VPDGPKTRYPARRARVKASTWTKIGGERRRKKPPPHRLTIVYQYGVLEASCSCSKWTHRRGTPDQAADAHRRHIASVTWSTTRKAQNAKPSSKPHHVTIAELVAGYTATCSCGWSSKPGSRDAAGQAKRTHLARKRKPKDPADYPGGAIMRKRRHKQLSPHGLTVTPKPERAAHQGTCTCGQWVCWETTARQVRQAYARHIGTK
jgi:hypothetical protein